MMTLALTVGARSSMSAGASGIDDALLPVGVGSQCVGEQQADESGDAIGVPMAPEPELVKLV